MFYKLKCINTYFECILAFMYKVCQNIFGVSRVHFEKNISGILVVNID